MMFALFFSVTAEAKKKKGKGKPKVDKEKVERKKKRDEEKNAVNEILEKKDTDDNDQLTMGEWVTGEKNQAKATQQFVEGDKNKDRHLSRSEIGAILGF